MDQCKNKVFGEVGNLWIFGNTAIFLFMIIGLATSVIFEGWARSPGVIVASYSIFLMCYRRGLYVGYFDGYEHGCVDSQYSQKKVLKELEGDENAEVWVLDGIKDDFVPKTYLLSELFDEMGWSEKDKEEYRKSVVVGIKKLKVLRWF